MAWGTIWPYRRLRGYFRWICAAKVSPLSVTDGRRCCYLPSLSRNIRPRWTDHNSRLKGEVANYWYVYAYQKSNGRVLITFYPSLDEEHQPNQSFQHNFSRCFVACDTGSFCKFMLLLRRAMHWIDVVYLEPTDQLIA